MTFNRVDSGTSDQQPAPSTGTFTKLLCEKEAARLLGLSHRTLQDWRQIGRGPRYLKMGHRIRYRVADLEGWMEGLLQQHTSYRNAA